VGGIAKTLEERMETNINFRYGIFSDFEEFLPSASKVMYSSATDATVPSTPVSDTSAEAVPRNGDPCTGNKEDFFNIPTGFVLQPGVTMPLLKSAFNVIAKMCCPSKANGFGCSDNLKRLCDELPNPCNLPPVETCELSRELLPVLREGVDEKATDLALMRAARQVYEVYYTTVMKKLQDKNAASRTPTATNASMPAGGQ
jgi:hypothetical protein